MHATRCDSPMRRWASRGQGLTAVALQALVACYPDGVGRQTSTATPGVGVAATAWAASPPPQAPPPVRELRAVQPPRQLYDLTRVAAENKRSPRFGLNGAPGASQLPPGWVSFGGFPVPAIPGLTVPVAPVPYALPAPRVPDAGTTVAGRPGAAPPDVPDDGRGDHVAIDRWVPTYGLIANASRAIIDRALTAPTTRRAAALPELVDHRADGTEGPVRNQGLVGACTAFSLASAIDHALLREVGSSYEPRGVAPMHLWSRYARPSMGAAADANRGRPIAAERTLPWGSRACGWMPCEVQACDPLASLFYGCGHTPEGGEVEAADASPYVVVSAFKAIPATTVAWKTALAHGEDVWFGSNIDDGWELEGYKLAITGLFGAEPLLSDVDLKGKPAGHAYLLVGYREEPDGTYFLIHNSWGRLWGDGGYAWVRGRTLLSAGDSLEAYVVSARLAAQLRTPAFSLLGPATCAPGLLPDSSTQQCTAPCPNGGARHGGVCPIDSQCPSGLVNLTGSCVASPANTVGRDPKNGLLYACAAQGCVYGMIFGQWGCQSAMCGYSCPAPTYNLAGGADGLACTY